LSYVDAYFDRGKDTIYAVERNNGIREYREFPVSYNAYFDDPGGKHTSIYGTKVSRISERSSSRFQKELKVNSHRRLFESDMNITFQTLAKHYMDTPDPKLHIGLFDIEVDFDPKKGFAPPSDPFSAVTAISIHLSWLDKLVTMCIKPDSMSKEEAQKVCDKFDDTVLFDTETEMLKFFLDLIEDVDVLSGWNSEGFDIPYMVNRVIRMLGMDYAKKFCLWNMKPKRRTFERFGKEEETYDLVGRLHMDYLQLYRKYTYHEMHSYSLDAIGEYEIGEKKTAYEGSIDYMYNNDFEKFIEYNRQDTLLLVKIDNKNQFIDLANVIAHANTVLLQTTMGAVAVTDQAIVNEAHQQGKVVPNRKRDHGPNISSGNANKQAYDALTSTTAAGAYVAYPKKGMHDWIGSVDINSLYPSIIRALNMSPETIVGQFQPDYTNLLINKKYEEGKTFAEAWEGVFASVEYDLIINKDKDKELTFVYEDGTIEKGTGAQFYRTIFGQGRPWNLSANGTVFRNDIPGIIPALLTRWYSERKELQSKKKEASTPEETSFWDKRQLVKKINLNSLYGALCNPGCRFFDIRVGQSITLTGRSITKHMAAQINKLIDDQYDYLGKSIIYGDTDSVYFSAWPCVKEQVEAGDIQWNKEFIIDLYDSISDSCNLSFPNFMRDAFNCPLEYGKIIAGGREIVAERGLFITKKRYAALIFDLEGYRTDRDGPGKLKAMGLDLKRSDTPKAMQVFLEELLLEVLKGAKEDKALEMIRDFRFKFANAPSWLKGSPKRVNKLTFYGDALKRKGKVTMPGHVRAAINWNNLRKMNGDRYSMEIQDGYKVIVCKLKPNPMNMTSIAYPVDELQLPEWFKEMPFDDDTMEKTIVDQKVRNLLGVMDWKLDDAVENNNFGSLFDFN